MDMMRIGSDRMNLVCRNCLERKPQKQEQKVESTKAKKQEELIFKDYFCKKCKYNFKRAKHISTCPYCGASGSLMVKGSTAKIIADASKLKEDFRW